MREILFKAKRIDNGEWTEGYYECDPDLDIHYICGFNYYSSENGLEREFFNDEVNKETICQYTGLTDRNGNNIWENDVVKHYNKVGIGEPDKYLIASIRWEHNNVRFIQDTEDGKYSIIGSCNFEVIGNIFDNPELLENE